MPETTATFLSPWAGTLLRISVTDCRDETADHLSALVLVRPGGEALGLRLSDLQLLGALVEGWDDDRVRAVLGLSDASRRAARLAADLGFWGPGALVQHAAREGLFLPPALWPQLPRTVDRGV
ncbi:MAG: hypothetical protein JOZ82_08225 [Marmoricola sp.]|nr:hypothetical protein [Marmoricola sp.]